MTLTDTSRRRTDQGSLPVVLAIIFVVVLVSTALITRVLGDLDNVNLETKMAQARTLARSGVSDALFQIDQQGVTPSSFCNEPNSSGACTLTSIPGIKTMPYGSSSVYTAHYDSSDETYTVLSQGNSHGIAYAVQATIQRVPLVGSAVYGGAFTTFDGNSTTSVTVTDPYGNPIPGATADIAVGPGGTLTCNGPSDPNAEYVNYGGTISGCTPYEDVGPFYAPQQPSQSCPAPPNPYGAPPTPCLPAGVTSCSGLSSQLTGSDATGYTITGPAKLEPGIYVCRGGLTMTGKVDVDYAQSPLQNNGRVEIFMFPPVGSTTSPNLNMGAADVNACETIGTASTGTCLGGLVGDPADLVIYSWGSGTASLGGGEADAILWAPAMDMLLNGSVDNLTWTGSIVLGGITADGHPTFRLNLDERLESEFIQSNWQITNYIKTTPGFSIP